MDTVIIFIFKNKKFRVTVRFLAEDHKVNVQSSWNSNHLAIIL